LSGFKSDYLIVALACVLAFAFPPSMFRDLELSRDGEGVDLSEYELSETKVYDLELAWQKRFWQASVVEIWVDDCLRSLVVNGSDLSTEFSYCDFVGSKRIDLAPYLTGGRATLEIQIENLGGPGGLSITGMGSGVFTTFRYLLIFLLILTWLYRRGRAEDGVPRTAAELGAHRKGDEASDPPPSAVPFQRKLAAVPRTYLAVLLLLLAVIGGSVVVWLRDGAGQGAAKAEPAARERDAPRVTIPAFETGVGAPSWARDDRLNPRILIPGGELLMGSPDGVGYGDEQPQHRVRVARFWMQQHEVTNEEYRRFRPEHGFTPGQERHPVVNVTWHDALAYAQWLGGSLPTEAQWELAARGTRGRKYPWGDEEPTCARANFNPCGWRLKAVHGHPQGATPDGLEDLAGNVWEWSADWYADRYPAAEATDPRGPAPASLRVLRGGSFISGAGHLRGAYRGYYHPGFVGHDIGFRVVWRPAEGQD